MEQGYRLYNRNKISLDKTIIHHIKVVNEKFRQFIFLQDIFHINNQNIHFFCFNKFSEIFMSNILIVDLTTLNFTDAKQWV